MSRYIEKYKDPKNCPKLERWVTDGRIVRYPWEEWFKKGTFTLKRFRDYDCQPFSMTMMVRMNAKKEGIKVRTVTHDDTITVEVVE